MTYKFKEFEIIILKKIPHLEKNCYLECITEKGEHIQIFLKNGLISKKLFILEPGNCFKIDTFHKNQKIYLNKFDLIKYRPELNTYQAHKSLANTLNIINTIFSNKEFSPKIYHLTKDLIHCPFINHTNYTIYLLSNLLFIEGFLDFTSNSSNLNKLIFYITKLNFSDFKKIKIDSELERDIKNLLRNTLEDNFNSPLIQKLLQE